MMLSNEPASVELKKSLVRNEEVLQTAECDLNASGDLHLEDIFTPLSEHSINDVDDEYKSVAESDQKLTSLIEEEDHEILEEKEQSQNLSAEESFDKLVGNESSFLAQTPLVAKVYQHQSTTKSHVFPYAATNEISDMPKTDVQEWVDNLDIKTESSSFKNFNNSAQSNPKVMKTFEDGEGERSKTPADSDISGINPLDQSGEMEPLQISTSDTSIEDILQNTTELEDEESVEIPETQIPSVQTSETSLLENQSEINDGACDIPETQMSVDESEEDSRNIRKNSEDEDLDAAILENENTFCSEIETVSYMKDANDKDESQLIHVGKEQLSENEERQEKAEVREETEFITTKNTNEQDENVLEIPTEDSNVEICVVQQIDYSTVQQVNQEQKEDEDGDDFNNETQLEEQDVEDEKIQEEQDGKEEEKHEENRQIIENKRDIEIKDMFENEKDNLNDDKSVEIDKEQQFEGNEEARILIELHENEKRNDALEAEEKCLNADDKGDADIAYEKKDNKEDEKYVSNANRTVTIDNVVEEEEQQLTIEKCNNDDDDGTSECVVTEEAVGLHADDEKEKSATTSHIKTSESIEEHDESINDNEEISIFGLEQAQTENDHLQLEEADLQNQQTSEEIVMKRAVANSVASATSENGAEEFNNIFETSENKSDNDQIDMRSTEVAEEREADKSKLQNVETIEPLTEGIDKNTEYSTELDSKQQQENIFEADLVTEEIEENEKLEENYEHISLNTSIENGKLTQEEMVVETAIKAEENVPGDRKQKEENNIEPSESVDQNELLTRNLNKEEIIVNEIAKDDKDGMEEILENVQTSLENNREANEQEESEGEIVPTFSKRKAKKQKNENKEKLLKKELQEIDPIKKTIVESKKEVKQLPKRALRTRKASMSEQKMEHVEEATQEDANLANTEIEAVELAPKRMVRKRKGIEENHQNVTQADVTANEPLAKPVKPTIKRQGRGKKEISKDEVENVDTEVQNVTMEKRAVRGRKAQQSVDVNQGKTDSSDRSPGDSEEMTTKQCLSNKDTGVELRSTSRVQRDRELPRRAAAAAADAAAAAVAVADDSSDNELNAINNTISSRGRPRKPIAAVEKFFQEVRAKAGTPKRQLSVTSTPNSMRRAPKGALNYMETNCSTPLATKRSRTEEMPLNSNTIDTSKHSVTEEKSEEVQSVDLANKSRTRGKLRAISVESKKEATPVSRARRGRKAAVTSELSQTEVVDQTSIGPNTTSAEGDDTDNAIRTRRRANTKIPLEQQMSKQTTRTRKAKTEPSIVIQDTSSHDKIIEKQPTTETQKTVSKRVRKTSAAGIDAEMLSATKRTAVETLAVAVESRSRTRGARKKNVTESNKSTDELKEVVNLVDEALKEKDKYKEKSKKKIEEVEKEIIENEQRDVEEAISKGRRIVGKRGVKGTKNIDEPETLPEQPTQEEEKTKPKPPTRGRGRNKKETNVTAATTITTETESVMDSEIKEQQIGKETDVTTKTRRGGGKRKAVEVLEMQQTSEEVLEKTARETRQRKVVRFEASESSMPAEFSEPPKRVTRARRK